MKVNDAKFEENEFIERIIVSDDGTVAILYKGQMSVTLRSGGQNMAIDPLPVGTSLQVRKATCLAIKKPPSA